VGDTWPSIYKSILITDLCFCKLREFFEVDALSTKVERLTHSFWAIFELSGAKKECCLVLRVCLKPRCCGQQGAGPNAYSSGWSSKHSVLKVLSLSLDCMDLIRRRSACDVGAFIPSCSQLCVSSQDLFIVFGLSLRDSSKSTELYAFYPSLRGFALWLNGHSCFSSLLGIGWCAAFCGCVGFVPCSRHHRNLLAWRIPLHRSFERASFPWCFPVLNCTISHCCVVGIATLCPFTKGCWG